MIAGAKSQAAAHTFLYKSALFACPDTLLLLPALWYNKSDHSTDKEALL